MNRLCAVFKRELTGYFQTPLAYVFMVVFLISSGAFTFYLGDFFDRGVADLEPFFAWHPWLYLFLVPAVTMKLWAEERKSGTIELLMTLPISLTDMVLGKFLAAWVFVLIALSGTLPLWATVNYLGNPDNGVIFASYIGSALMAGAYLALGSAVSAMTKNQVIAFIITASISLIFVMAGYSLVIAFIESWMPQFLVSTLSSLSFISHFESITKGVIEFTSLAYFFSMIVFWLFLNLLILEVKRGGQS